MKYRVKFKCYWYNTGAADNHHYTNYEDFDKLSDAKAYADRVNHQYKTRDNFQEQQLLIKHEQFIEIENGFIAGEANIVKYYPSVETNL